jgi:uncharacterized protein YidB (DUF937 family)
MGLLDVLNGMRNGPGGGQHDASASSGGMSPITMAILALLAYKGIKHLSGNQESAPSGNPQRLPGSNPTQAGTQGGGLGDILGGLLGSGTTGSSDRGGLGGGLGDLLKGGLGGLLAGGAAGSVLSGGLGGLLKQFQQNGQGDVANSWVGTGPNRDMSDSDMAKSIGMDDINALSKHTGL